MTYTTNPFGQLDRIYKAVVTNLSKIKVANGDSIDVEYVAEAAIPLRPHDIIGATITVVDDDDNDVERMPNNFARNTFGYTLYLWVMEQDPSLLPKKLRDFCDDVWRKHHADHYLVVADGDLGGSGAKLLVSHRIVNVKREYSPPDGVATIQVECEHDFLVT